MTFYKGNGFRAVDNTEWVYCQINDDIEIITEKKYREMKRKNS